MPVLCPAVHARPYSHTPRPRRVPSDLLSHRRPGLCQHFDRRVCGDRNRGVFLLGINLSAIMPRVMRVARKTSVKEKLILDIHEVSGLLRKARRKHEISADSVTILEVKLYTLQSKYAELLSSTIDMLRKELPDATSRKNSKLREKKAKKAKQARRKTFRDKA